MTGATARFAGIAARRAAGAKGGIASICSAHPLVIEATLRHGARNGADVLIEATCNQVNHEGGYTGMTPAAFRAFVETQAGRTGFPFDRLILGGDHLGPNPWKHLPAAEAMNKAAAMIDAYASAGFTKLHLDTSMACADDSVALADETIAARAAELAAVAEAAVARSGDEKPVYIIGTEVPVPGGALEALDHMHVTEPADALRTVELHRQAFCRLGLDAAFARAVGVVVQPGVEFGNAEIIAYAPERATKLVAALESQPQFVFEAHSTDYQPAEALAALVRDGFAILKVGPWLTFALREALYGLSHIADALAPDPSRESLPTAMERIMLASPGNWQKYYPGTPDEQRLQRHFSFSDRIRYYWPSPDAQHATEALLAALGDREIPRPLISQYLGHLDAEVGAGRITPTAHELLIASVTRVLDIYRSATIP
ncbi:D-tagatose-bisphosphate aldolase, class II, non-catalytic subunit [Mesorhizobium sp. M1A.F.Ca.IN.020.30.1.1]|uniref:D-tagatose-bisphosphate aldolase, class II, non-catalytic subunit n=7 Tax=Mesorhizobium TaxID=68287 RepID=UPI000F762499|nr:MULTISPECIES: D-tagatose-bisphosphate aldolase, class II, non-catalytic subunit [unclassified Mesorhizobium]TGV89266.1 D-tagatose-bisphosphate aldolase, class II, non-catalytic subunit [Mesorhizobium sp. M00.F.Ca.ET.158.01.1.1]AZO59265.1 D-tagatose-bisphosphate aldolase, class II, non-catalytic subunit [Mesorhizobium sp. M1A.F.Ca.IN.022.06.1.1]MCT2578074.1 D-tagatose-bisphosphate aldolase, class II, non-catalytic subunit [Mesorhizobium sp. P13.3]MDF3167012.1 D-tagatose-bisphosphate aldolase,